MVLSEINSFIANTMSKTQVIGKLVSWYLTGYNFDELLLVQLLDMINWHYPTIIEHAEDWTTSYEQAGTDFSEMLHLAVKHNRVLTGLDDKCSQFGILISLFNYSDELSTWFVIDNNIKIDEKIIDGFYNIKDIEYWNMENNYNLLE